MPNSLFPVPKELQSYGDILFAQVACKADQHHLNYRNQMGLLNVILGLVLSLIFFFSLEFMRKEDDINRLKERRIPSIDQFTVQGRISRKDYFKFE